MNKILFFILILPLSIYSQNQFVKIENAKTNQPTFLINNDILISSNVFYKLKPKKIISLNILKYDISNDNHKNNISNLSEFGLIQIQTKQTFKSKTFSEIQAENNLPENSKFYLDGYYIDNPNYKIENNSINEIEILKSENEIIINIWTLPKNERRLTVGCSLSKK